MNDLHKDKKADALANLYRASYCIAVSDRKTGLSFVEKSLPFFNSDERKKIESLLATQKDDMILAENLCDLYLTMKTF